MGIGARTAAEGRARRGRWTVTVHRGQMTGTPPGTAYGQRQSSTDTLRCSCSFQACIVADTSAPTTATRIPPGG
jgi:hypothetical protein